MTDVARNARQVSRTLDGILQNLEGPIDKGIPLDTLNHGEATGRLFIQTKPFDVKLPMLPQGKADNQILSVVEGLKESVKDRDVVLVSKDINMRLKAAALNLVAEDYYNDKMIEDSDILYSGTLKLPANFWDEHGRNSSLGRRTAVLGIRSKDRWFRASSLPIYLVRTGGCHTVLCTGHVG